MKLQLEIPSEESKIHETDEVGLSELERVQILQRARNAPNELVIPNSQQLFARPFSSKFKLGLFLGSPSRERRSIDLEQYRRVRFMALSIFNQGTASLEPSKKALQRTQQAVKYFFALSHVLLSQTNQPFPLAKYNKCLGMVAVPNSKLVMIAISQDKMQAADEALRHQMVLFLEQINRPSNEWRFELASIPTPSQYLIPRTLRDIDRPATQVDIDPHTRCVEVALMVALNKIGRFKNFKPADVGVMAFGGTLWASPDGKDAIGNFSGVERNKKYTKQSPIQIELQNGDSAWIDIWEPCACHCEIYKYEMAAVAGAGGPGTSFAQPCSEWSVPTVR